VVFGDGVEAALAPLLEVAERQQHQRRAVLRDQRAGIFERQLLARRMARLQRCGPVGPLGHHRLGEDDQLRHLAGMQRRQPGLPERGAVVAEQGAGRRIGLEDRVGMRVDQQHGVDGKIEHGGAGGRLLGRDFRALWQQADIHGGLRNFVIDATNFRVSRKIVMANLSQHRWDN
jgi:hypothetical protein